jgi:hypothetical protein
VTGHRKGLGSSVLLAVVSLVVLFGGCGEDDPTGPLVPPCATPTFDPPPGVYARPVSLTILCATPDATIRYTADGTDPTEESQLYSNPFAVSNNRTIKAKAWKEDYVPSEVAIGTYAFACSIAVIAPVGGERLPAGEPFTIRWSSTVCVGPVRIELLLNDAVCDTIAQETPDAGGYSWDTQACGGPEGEYKIRVTNIASGAADQSHGPFSIEAPCTITVLSPEAGESWQSGESHEIRWSTTGECGRSFRIELLLDGVPCRTLAEAATGSGFTWEVLPCGDDESGYQIRVTDPPSGRSGISEGTLSIVPRSCILSVTSPAASEQWQEGTEHQILWSSTDCGGRVRIDLVRLDQDCSTLAEETANDGSFAWSATRCGEEEGGYWIRVTDLDSGSSGASMGNFSIVPEPCTLELTSPDGGEVWTVGTEQTILWTQSNCGGPVRIELLSGGIACRVITLTTPNNGSYPWTVERCGVAEGGYTVRITDLETGTTSVSAVPFAIPLPPCRLTLVSPNGGESWVEGSDREIVWTSDNCVGPIQVDLLRDGVPCATIAEGAADTGSLLWNPRKCAAEETGYTIRLTDLSSAASDASDGSFSIGTPPPCRPVVTAPASGARWVEGTEVEIRWEPSTCDTSVRIELLHNGTLCSTISAATPNDGTFSWGAQRCGSAEVGYKVRVVGIESGEGGESEQTFSIIGACALALTSPVGGETWISGSEVRIEWETAGACGPVVRIDLLRDDVICTTITEETQNDGLVLWHPSRCAGEEDGYRIRVADPESGVVAESPSTFRIIECQIQVTAPNGGESWKKGTQHEIAWTSTDCSGAVTIELLRDGEICRTLATGTPDDGSYLWSANDCAGIEEGYTIRVSDTAAGSGDDSDAPFEIVHCRLELLSPNGGENWPRGSAQTITWTSSNCGEFVDIYVICGDYEDEEAIALTTPNDGSFEWTADIPCTDPCSAWIYIAGDDDAVDGSDHHFCVCPPCQLAVTSPNGGEAWKEGTQHEIRWTSTDCSATVKIELLRTGTFCRTITDSTPDDGSYVWNFENCGPPSDYTIRVTSPCGIQDASDGAFTIPECSLAVTSPDGGERWEPASPQTITWTSSTCGDQVKIDLLMNGSVCRTIAASAPNTGSFVWTAEACNQIGCGHKIRVTDLETSKSDESASTFCICPVCAPTVTQPDGGESWEEGTVQEIHWEPGTGCDVTVKIELIMNGVVCGTIASATPNDGSATWTAQRCGSSTDGYKVRVTGLYCQQSDESGQAFQILPPPCGLTLTSPNGGESWTLGTSHEITWDRTGDCGGDVRLDLIHAGSACLQIAASTPNDGSYTWTASQCGSLGSDYSIRVTELPNGAADASDAVFSIPVCAIAVTAPAGGERWVEGTSHTITWTSSHCTGTVRIELLRDGTLCRTIATDSPDDGSFTWTAENCGDIETGYTLRVADSVTGSSDLSDAFSIPQPPCAIAVISPDGAERWSEGTQHNLRWSSSSCGGTVDIDLLLKGTGCRSIADGTSNDGAFLWTVQRCGADTTGYAIRVTDSVGGTVDASDQVFTIPCAACPFTITSPAGGESWQEGSPRTITWSPPGCDTAVKIELLLNGAVCRTLAAGTEDDGSFAWTPERCGSSTSGYRIRITGLTCGRKIQSAQTFSITPIPDLLFFAQDLEFCAGEQNVEILVYGRNSQAIKGYGINLCFDPAVFECVDIVTAGTRGEGAIQFAELCQTGCARAGVIFSAACPPQIAAGEGVLLRVIVNVKPTAPPGPTQLDLTSVDPAYNTMTLCNGSGTDPVLRDGTVQICPALPRTGDRGTR